MSDLVRNPNCLFSHAQAKFLFIPEIKGYFKGYADVKWTETRSTGKSTYTVTYKGHETYFDHKIVLLGKGKIVT